MSSGREHGSREGNAPKVYRDDVIALSPVPHIHLPFYVSHPCALNSASRRTPPILAVSGILFPSPRIPRRSSSCRGRYAPHHPTISLSTHPSFYLPLLRRFDLTAPSPHPACASSTCHIILIPSSHQLHLPDIHPSHPSHPAHCIASHRIASHPHLIPPYPSHHTHTLLITLYIYVLDRIRYESQRPPLSESCRSTPPNSPPSLRSNLELSSVRRLQIDITPIRPYEDRRM
ncbi:hypothetical protein C8J57DRAFT_1527778 [Mycena rebaudengoi]|nr:hypothetical protein C8J57DRAFT_1527778 [Mycena rebaudengoi]